VQDLSAIAESHPVLRMKPHDELVNTLRRDAETFDQIRAVQGPVERAEQSIRRRARDKPPEGLAPKSPLRVRHDMGDAVSTLLRRLPASTAGPADQAGAAQVLERLGDRFQVLFRFDRNLGLSVQPILDGIETGGLGDRQLDPLSDGWHGSTRVLHVGSFER
jgi:hypothetical protein